MKTTVAARTIALAALTVAAVVLAGCSTINPITTEKEYQASDGVTVDIGDDAKALNLLVITTAEGAPAVLTGSVYNDSDVPLEVSFSIDSVTPWPVTVPAHDAVQLGTGDHQVLVTGASPVGPGHIANVVMITDAAGADTVPVPVLDGTLPEYQDIVAAIPPLPSPSATPAASATPDPTATS